MDIVIRLVRMFRSSSERHGVPVARSRMRGQKKELR